MRYYCLDKLINLHDNYRKVFRIDQHSLLLLQINGERHLINSYCPHRGHPLIEASIDGNDLRCPLHGYRFNISVGNLIYPVDGVCKGLHQYELVYEQTEIGVML